MQVSLSDTGGLTRRLEVAVPANEVAQEVQQRLKQLSRTARLKGFRPGKAPLAVITKQFGEQVRAEVLNDLMRSSFAEAVSQEKLRPAGGPRIEPIALGPGDGPQVRGALRGAARDPGELPARRSPSRSPRPTVTEADVDAMIENMRAPAPGVHRGRAPGARRRPGALRLRGAHRRQADRGRGPEGRARGARARARRCRSSRRASRA